MANKILSVGALNIAMHAPHSIDRYVDLMQSSYHSRNIVAFRGTSGALIGALHPIDKDNLEKGFTGELYRFLKLDPNEPWFNVSNNEAASKDEIKEIKIPEYLKPHLARFSFVFFPKGHRLYIETKSSGKTLGLSTAATIFKNIFNKTNFEKFKQIEVTIEPDKKTLDDIFKIASIRYLEIELVRPNPDDHFDEEKRLLERLEKQNARKMDVYLTSSHNASIKPDNETKMLARIASSNGYVKASGKDNTDKPITLSTQDIPWVENMSYDTKLQQHTEALIKIAARMHKYFDN
jgi:hypothetical protein